MLNDSMIQVNRIKSIISDLSLAFDGETPKNLLLLPNSYNYRIFSNGTFDVWLSEAKKGSFVEEHKHNEQREIFNCIFGSVLIKENDKETILKSGESKIIPSGSHHSLLYLEDTKLITIVMPPINLEIFKHDIKD